jgi:hypothetical protein
MEEAVKVYFCDLCNESVPLKDVETGVAKTIKGKVVGVCCLPLLGGAAEKRAAPSPQNPQSLVFLGGLIIVAIAAAAWFLDWRTQSELRRHEQGLARRLGTEFGAHGEALKDLRARAQEAPDRKDLAALAAGTGAAVEPVQASVRSLEQKLEAGLAIGQGSRDELKKSLENLAQRQSAADGVLVALGEELRKMAGDLQAVRQMPLAPGTFGGGPPSGAGDGGPAAPPGVAAGPRGEDSGIPPALSHFVKQLADPDAGTRWTAVEKLSGSGEKRVVSHLVPVLKDVDPFVRRICAAGLGELGAREAAAGLIEALADGESIVRDAAYRSLRKLTGQNIVFDPEASADKRAEGVRRWNEWWRANKESFLAGR